LNKIGDVIRKAKEQGGEEKREERTEAGREAGKHENMIPRKHDRARKLVTADVPKFVRAYWAARAKDSDVTVREVIIRAMAGRFGLPAGITLEKLLRDRGDVE